MGKQYDTESPYEMTVAEFLNSLERIRTELMMDLGVYMPDGEKPVAIGERYKEGKVQGVLRFVALNELANMWGEPSPDKLPKTVFEKLNAFLGKNLFITSKDLETRWQKTLMHNQGVEDFPQEPIKNAINEACKDKDRDKKELKNRYGIEDFFEDSYDCVGATRNDVSIVYILALILLWFTVLPCTEEAETERSNYRKRLQLKLKLLINPSEFKEVLRAVYGDWVLNELRKTHSSGQFRAVEECDYTQTEENKIEKERDLGVSKRT